MPPDLQTPTAPVAATEPVETPPHAAAPRTGDFVPVAEPGARKWGSIEIGFFDRCEAISEGRAPVEEPSRMAPRRLTLPQPIERLPFAGKVALAAGVAVLLAGCVIWAS